MNVRECVMENEMAAQGNLRWSAGDSQIKVHDGTYGIGVSWSLPNQRKRLIVKAP